MGLSPATVAKQFFRTNKPLPKKNNLPTLHKWLEQLSIIILIFTAVILE
jgi:hypothetical protein